MFPYKLSKPPFAADPSPRLDRTHGQLWIVGSDGRGGDEIHVSYICTPRKLTSTVLPMQTLSQLNKLMVQVAARRDGMARSEEETFFDTKNVRNTNWGKK